jgi:hypothetical protein
MQKVSSPATSSWPRASWKAMLLPLLVAIYPPLFHYGNNARIVTFASLARALLLYSILAIVFYGLFSILTRGQPTKAANAAFVFLIFFHLYGVLYNYLYNQDIIQVEDYTLLPLIVLLALYLARSATKVKNSEKVWKSAILLVSILIVSNLFKIVPAEIAKYRASNPKAANASALSNASEKAEYPDIYFIILDEFAGFDSMRNYWKYQEIDEFRSFLQSKGFYVAESSHSSSSDTLHQMSERLNYQEYPLNANPDIYYGALVNNRAMSYLKSLGYTTVVFDETKLGYPAAPSMSADYLFEYDSSNVSNTTADMGNLFDDFGILVAENTMLRAFPLFYSNSLDPMFEKHQEMVFFTAGKLPYLDEVPSPKFVHAHLLLPHYPFMFLENGNINNPIYYYNWNYYLDNYKFTIKFAEKMVNNILENSDPENPPIIILQSDHGARNTPTRHGVLLEDYPEEYKTHILNALYLPGYDTSQLSQDMNPINTFPLIFNHYFDADIPLAK